MGQSHGFSSLRLSLFYLSNIYRLVYMKNVGQFFYFRHPTYLTTEGLVNRGPSYCCRIQPTRANALLILHVQRVYVCDCE